jgi:hypothetical protein
MPHSPTPEETFLWDCARHWRTPEHIEIPASLDWARIAQVAIPNRMAHLLRRILSTRSIWETLPAAPRAEIAASADRLRQNADTLGGFLARYLQRAAARGIPTAVLKGLSISSNIYGDPAMRPGGDIDLLVRPHDVPACLAALEEIGIGAYWHNLMHDDYYTRHHLHQQRSTPDTKTWFEIHWALDHPYTLLTIDYAALLDRATPGTLLDQPVADLTPPDLLLTLAVHLVKHAIHLPATVQRADLPRLVLAEGMLMYHLDIAETIHQHPDLDWEALIQLARQTGTAEIFGAVLRAGVTLLRARVPEGVVQSLPVGRRGVITRRAMHAVVNRQVSQYLGTPRSKIWDALVITNGAFILRPIRLLESAAYFLPPVEYLQRAYGQCGLLSRVGHLWQATGKFTRFGWDSIYFAIERYRRLKRLGYSASLFNRLDGG